MGHDHKTVPQPQQQLQQQQQPPPTAQTPDSSGEGNNPSTGGRLNVHSILDNAMKESRWLAIFHLNVWLALFRNSPQLLLSGYA